MAHEMGYSDQERSAAKTLMAMGAADPDEFLAKADSLGISFKGGMVDHEAPMNEEMPPGAPMGEEPHEEMSPMGEPEHDTPRHNPDMDAGMNLVILRRKAAKSAMSKHGE